MSEVKSGDKVRIHYTGTLKDGTVFDSSQGRDPLEFEVGSGQIIPGMDKHLPGMAVGEKKTIVAEASRPMARATTKHNKRCPAHRSPPKFRLRLACNFKCNLPKDRLSP